MENILKATKTILLIVLLSVLTTSCDSYERKMERLNKAASEFKASLGTDATILAEVIDSTAQEIIYIKWVAPDDSWEFLDNENDEKYGVIEVHNYATGVTERVLTDWYAKEENGNYHYFKDGHLVKDRLFLNLWDGGYGTAVVYLDVRDNSIHNVASCAEAKLSDNQIVLTEMYIVHDAEFMYQIEYGEKKYPINPGLTDIEYEKAARLRAEEIRYIERKAIEEDKRHRQIAKKEKKDEDAICVLNDLDGSGGGLELRMSGLIGNVSVSFWCEYDITLERNEGDLGFENDESWNAKIKWVSDESGRMEVSLEDGAKGTLVGYLHGEKANATYEGTYIDPSGNETPFKFFDDFRYWGF